MPMQWQLYPKLFFKKSNAYAVAALPKKSFLKKSNAYAVAALPKTFFL